MSYTLNKTSVFLVIFISTKHSEMITPDVVNKRAATQVTHVGLCSRQRCGSLSILYYGRYVEVCQVCMTWEETTTKFIHRRVIKNN